MERTNEQLEIQENYRVCSNCLTIISQNDDCSRPECFDHCTIEYWTFWEWFPKCSPMTPILGYQLQLPPLNLFKSQEIINILCTGDMNHVDSPSQSA